MSVRLVLVVCEDVIEASFEGRCLFLSCGGDLQTILDADAERT